MDPNEGLLAGSQGSHTSELSLMASTFSLHWTNYELAPSGASLLPLLSDVGVRSTLIRAVEDLFHARREWRVALHAAMLHLNMFEPHAAERDLLKASWFCRRSSEISKNDPRVCVVRARIHWEQRLPLAVLFDIEQAREGAEALEREVGAGTAGKVIGQTFLLEGIAKAYLMDCASAQDALIVAERAGVLEPEGPLRLLLAAEREHPIQSAWAAERIVDEAALGPRPRAMLQRERRLALLRLLQARCASD